MRPPSSGPPRRRHRSPTATSWRSPPSTAAPTTTACRARRRTSLPSTSSRRPEAMEIPYNVEARPDTGVFNAKLGVWLFLASEVMLFGALFSSYVLLRTGAPHWPVGKDTLHVLP